jgi:signal transduction histidine kinase
MRMSIRLKLQVITGLLLAGTGLVFISVAHLAQRRAVLEGIDRTLLTAAHLAEQVPGPHYHDGIVDATSVSPAEYRRIVATNNRLCRELDLQYLWSVLVVNGRIVFTTATSPSKDIEKGDQAGFFEVHRDPHAFDRAFGTMQPDFSSFKNEWGYGRMVLVPAVDARGRKYAFGASVDIDNLKLALRQSLVQAILIGTAIIAAGLLISAFLARSFAKPIIRLKYIAEQIAAGKPVDGPVVGGSLEMRSLGESIAHMNASIHNTICALEVEVAERKAAEAELAEHRDKLEAIVRRRTAALQRSNEDLQQFAYIASHDLQEPLRTVKSFVQLLAKRYSEKLDAEAQEFIDYAVDGVARMEQLIAALLTYSRVDTKGHPFSEADAEQILEEALSNLTAAIQESHATISHDHLPKLLCDQAQLVQVFQNLIGNSLKFRGDEPPRVHIAAVREDDNWRFAFRDNGIGIDPEYQQRIFMIFQRLHTRKAYPGTGIGLAYCRKVIERHGGRIWVESKEGEGATFHFTLPVEPIMPQSPETDVF